MKHTRHNLCSFTFGSSFTELNIKPFAVHTKRLTEINPSPVWLCESAIRWANKTGPPNCQLPKFLLNIAEFGRRGYYTSFASSLTPASVY